MKKKCNVLMTGGIGNQMFQYAFFLALKAKGYRVQMNVSLYNMVEMHQGYELQRVFNIVDPIVNYSHFLYILWLKLLIKFHPSCLMQRDYSIIDLAVLDNPKKYYYGCWLSEKYFNSIKESVRDSFEFKNIDSINQNIADKMRTQNSVSIHVRRGDYIKYGITLYDERYYAKAVSYIQRKISAPFFYFFSDDFNEARAIAEKLDIPYMLVDINKGDNSYKDMFLMTQCKHNIIANSSFSWWGAWLNSYTEKIVIAPKEWIAGDINHKPQLETWILM